MNAPAAAGPAGLAMMLRAGTATAHKEAESGRFVRSILEGTVDKAAYGRFLVGLRALYDALERGMMANRGDPRVAPLVIPSVFRVKSIDADLAFYGVAPTAPVLASATAYAAQLDDVSKRAPHLLVAHAYTRTLGDLSGGQALKKCIQRSFKLEGSDGVAFYEFPDVGDLNAFKGEYRVKLDTLPMSDAEKREVVEEAVRAFHLNGAITQELSA